MRAFAAALDVSMPTAYKYLQQNNLPAPRTDGRPDIRAFTDDELREARDRHTSTAALAASLGCCVKTVLTHLNRLGISYNREHTPLPVCEKAFNLYKGEVTIRDIADHLKVSLGAVRSCLDRHVVIMWVSSRPPVLPRPRTHVEIKVYHALAADYKGTAEQLADSFRLPVDVVSGYFARAGKVKK
jgi:transposase